MLGTVTLVALVQVPWAGLFTRPAAAKATASAGKADGLTLSFAASATVPAVDARSARLVAIAVPPGGVVSPMLPPGPFVATWTGLIATPRKIKEDYRFTAEGTGHLTLTVNGKPVLDVTGDLSAHPSDLITLHKTRNKIVATYEPPPTGPATVRLLWARDDHPDYFNPVPPTVFTHDVSADGYDAHGKVRVGRDLLASMRCAACHQGLTGAVPELSQDAPDLTAVGRRLTPTYLAHWIADPHKLKPTTDMPKVVHGESAADLAAYLSADAPPPSEYPAADAATVGRGGHLFTALGCVACHVAPGMTDSDPSLNRVSLDHVKAKFRPVGLADWLRAPEAHYAWVKMPNFHLTDGEVTALSAWLVSRCKDDALPAVPAGDAARGKAAFASAGCMSCHLGPGNTHVSPATAIDLKTADWTHGCTASDKGAIGKGVDYAFAAEQLDALRAFAGTDWQPTLKQDAPADFAARQMSAVRCNACHHIDDAYSAWSTLDGDVSAIESDLPPLETEPQGDQSPPPLTWAGEKLRTSWAAAFIGGHVPYKPRTWLVPRMPSYASRADSLAAGLAAEHGVLPTADPLPPPDESLAKIGHDLTSQTRFGCVKCHSAGSQAAIAPFEAYAPNLAHVTDRLRHDYYTSWMRNPQVFLPGTKMPAFGNAEGKTPYREILGGDAAAEYGAIWQYLLAGEKLKPAQ